MLDVKTFRARDEASVGVAFVVIKSMIVASLSAILLFKVVIAVFILSSMSALLIILCVYVFFATSSSAINPVNVLLNAPISVSF
jgi:hypothetical protein